MTHRAKKIDHGHYEYRGIEIERDDSRKGYWGYWNASFAGSNQGFSTMKDAKSSIDAYREAAKKRIAKKPI